MTTFYLNNEKLKDFTQIWTNRILFEKILEKNLKYQCDIFLVRPSYENDNPFEVIGNLDTNVKVVIWYLDTIDKKTLMFIKGKIYSLCSKGFDLTLLLPEFYHDDEDTENFESKCKVINNYSMADCILEQQQIDHKDIMTMRKNTTNIYREKYFLSYNGNVKNHRVDLVNHIKRNNHLDKFDLSFSSFFWGGQEGSLHLDLKEKSYYTSTKLNLPIYFNSYFDVITAAKYDTNDVYIDEKVYKSFACFKPFLLIGQYNTLKVLKDLGFKTFDEIFDESYDNEKDNQKRLKLVLKEIDKISKMSKKQVDDLYHSVNNILDHNYTHLQRYIRKVDKDILEIF